MLFKLISLILSLFVLTNSQNLNGDIYSISNPNTIDNYDFSTNFKEISTKAEYFDIYSPIITSKYGEVYWTMMEAVKLPNNIVDRFANKTMAIIGYETDQVFKRDSGDISVPITWSYNHHYETYLQGANTKMIKVNYSNNDWGIYNHGSKQHWKIIPENNIEIPTSQFFSEGNGGESRGSFHGYPKNYAQLIKSPELFKIQPMQIDTRNRDPRYINDSIFHTSLLPKRSASPKNAYYSGLLECPCTDRIKRVIKHNYNIKTNNKCNININNASICLNQVKQYGKLNTTINIINNNNLPPGCSFKQDVNNIIYNITFNKFNSNKNCGSNSNLYQANIDTNLTNISINLKIDKTKNIDNQVKLNITGPYDKWFGIAFNAYTMNDKPYSIIINENVTERKLGNHDQGILLNPSIKIISNKVINNKRNVILTRSIKGLNENYYTFDLNNDIPILSALGVDNDFAYHKIKSANTLSLKSYNSDTCICDNGITGTLDGLPFHKNCAAEPTADLLQQKNPSCFVETYQGGLSCCHHKTILLDKNQEQPEHEMSYQIKFRFWFEDYNNHNSLIRLYFQTEAYSGEYDVPKCASPYECIHTITSRWQAKDMIDKKLITSDSTGVNLIYAGPHCHAPSCISMELYNADTGMLICGMLGDLGKGTDKKFDEKGYIKLNPCLYGNDKGLYKPPYFSWNTNLSSIKKNNNTYAHYGEMASWQMRGIIVYNH